MDTDEFTRENFTANLKLATSYYQSVSELCRKVGINRQQFMKYLAGTSFPSRYTLRKICDFFGVDVYEILMPHDQFKNIVRLRPDQGADDFALPPGTKGLLAMAQRNRGKLAKAHGFYHQYYLSFSAPHHVLRTLVYIYGWNDFTLYKRLERLRRSGRDEPPEVYKYAGIVSVVGDRMHFLDQETITGSEITQTVVFMNYRNRITLLTGLTMGVSGGDAHQPSASRTVMEYIGRSVNLKQALSECQLYDGHSNEIPQHIMGHLTAGGRINRPLRAEVL